MCHVHDAIGCSRRATSRSCVASNRGCQIAIQGNSPMAHYCARASFATPAGNKVGSHAVMHVQCRHPVLSICCHRISTTDPCCRALMGGCTHCSQQGLHGPHRAVVDARHRRGRVDAPVCRVPGVAVDLRVGDNSPCRRFAFELCGLHFRAAVSCHKHSQWLLCIISV